jgi:hypothetical protein
MHFALSDSEYPVSHFEHGKDPFVLLQLVQCGTVMLHVYVVKFRQ